MDENEITKREVVERLVSEGGLSRNDAQMVADLAEKAVDDAKQAIMAVAKLVPSEKLQIIVLAVELMTKSQAIVYRSMGEAIIQRKE